MGNEFIIAELLTGSEVRKQHPLLRWRQQKESILGFIEPMITNLMALK